MKLSKTLVPAAVGLACLAASCGQTVKARKAPIARYRFEEGSGSTLIDSSGNGQNGVMVGGPKWVKGKRGFGLLFDGTSRVNVPDSPRLDLKNGFSALAWVKGNGEPLRFLKEPPSYPPMRGADFQVCGDRIYFATMSDQPASDHQGWRGWIGGIWTGTADVNLTRWRAQRRTNLPFTGVEPKLQVVGNRIYYEYFGQGANGAFQIWTAESNRDGSGWAAVQRTHEKTGYRTEQGSLQVVGDKILYGFPEMVGDEWHTWAGLSNLDGTSFQSVQQTTGAGPAYEQIVGNRRYILMNLDWGQPHPSAGDRPGATFVLAASDLRGAGWQTLRRFKHIAGGFTFRVNGDRIYLAYAQYAASHGKQRAHLFTGSMKADGTDFQVVPRQFDPAGDVTPGVSQEGMQIVGNRIDYTLTGMKGGLRPGVSSARDSSQPEFSFWSAESDIDGNNWKVIRRTHSSANIQPQYKSLVVVGGKSYYSAAKWPLNASSRELYFQMLMGTSGSNIVNKGDAFGIGMTDRHEVRAFVNVGQDYLFRAEDPRDSSGAIAESRIDDQWHFVAATYDGNTLKLYVDGTLKASTPYRASLGRNPFPLMIGDGFQGTVGDVELYDHALTQQAVLGQMHSLQK